MIDENPHVKSNHQEERSLLDKLENLQWRVRLLEPAFDKWKDIVNMFQKDTQMVVIKGIDEKSPVIDILVINSNIKVCTRENLKHKLKLVRPIRDYNVNLLSWDGNAEDFCKGIGPKVLYNTLLSSDDVLFYRTTTSKNEEDFVFLGLSSKFLEMTWDKGMTEHELLTLMVNTCQTLPFKKFGSNKALLKSYIRFCLFQRSWPASVDEAYEQSLFLCIKESL